MKNLFELGHIVATPGALQAFTEAGETPFSYIVRHAQLDPGELTAEDVQANRRALIDGSRVFSAFRLSTGVRIWIITESDRSSTCALLPEEY